MGTEILTEADLKLLRDALGESPGARLLVELASLRSEVAELRKDAAREQGFEVPWNPATWRDGKPAGNSPA